MCSPRFFSIFNINYPGYHWARRHDCMQNQTSFLMLFMLLLLKQVIFKNFIRVLASNRGPRRHDKIGRAHV